MKKYLAGLLTGIILMTITSVFAATQLNAKYIDTKISLDGRELNISTVGITDEQTTVYAPVKALFEALGYKVSTDKFGDTIKLQSPLTDLQQVVKACKDSCVMIYVYKDGQLVGGGSGFVYNGFIITAKHVADMGDAYKVFADDDRFASDAYRREIETEGNMDVAVLTSGIKAAYVTLGDSDRLVEGQKIVSITSPKGDINAVDECIYTGKVFVDGKYHLGISETSIDSGSSGGAVFNYKNELIGMVVMGNGKTSEAIPINTFKNVLQKLK